MPEAAGLRCVVTRNDVEFLWLLHWVRRRGHGLCAIIVGSNRWSLPLVQRFGRSLSGLIFLHHGPNSDEHLSGCDGIVSLLVAPEVLLHILHGRVEFLR